VAKRVVRVLPSSAVDLSVGSGLSRSAVVRLSSVAIPSVSARRNWHEDSLVRKPNPTGALRRSTPR
jgi:hypothetical protein